MGRRFCALNSAQSAIDYLSVRTRTSPDSGLKSFSLLSTDLPDETEQVLAQSRRVTPAKYRQSLALKIFRFYRSAIRCTFRLVPFRSEGRVANVTKREAECDGRGGVVSRATSRAVLLGLRWLRVQAGEYAGDIVLRTAKSCGPGAPMQASCERRC
jgi:hypothetical protein